MEQAKIPPKGEWAVNQMQMSGLLFIMESHGDGMGHIVNLDLDEMLAPLGISGSDSALRPFLERICHKHNEAISQ